MTYRDIKEALEKLDDQQLDMDATIYDCFRDEFYLINRWRINNRDDDNGDILDEGHPYLTFMPSLV